MGVGGPRHASDTLSREREPVPILQEAGVDSFPGTDNP